MMFRTLEAFFQSLKSTTSGRTILGDSRQTAPRPRRKTCLALESLEERLCLSPTALVYTAPELPHNAPHVITVDVVETGVLLKEFWIDIKDNNKLVDNVNASGVASVTITGAANSQNFFNIEGMMEPTTVKMASTADVVTLGNNANYRGGTYQPGGSNLSSLDGTLMVNGFHGAGRLIVDDSDDTGRRNAVIGSSSITGLAQYGTIDYSGVNNLTVYGSAGSNNQYRITAAVSLSTGTTFNDEGLSDTIVVTSASGALTLNGDGNTGTVTEYSASNGTSNLTVNSFSSTLAGHSNVGLGSYTTTITGYASETINSQSSSDQAKIIPGNQYGAYSSFDDNLGPNLTDIGFKLGGGASTLMANGFSKAFGMILSDGVFWMPSTGGVSLDINITQEYEQLGGGGLQGLLKEGTGAPGTFGMPTPSSNDIGAQDTMTFQNGVIEIHYGADSAAVDGVFSVLQVGNTLNINWQTLGDVYAVLLGWEIEDSQKIIQTGRLPGSGSYTLTFNQPPRILYSFYLDTIGPGASYSGWDYQTAYNVNN